ncbi:MAG: InlB B-repeat-containing protein, partial [Treponema sp.]|nr:InlB B-repeat-containing protein [Treponema sp.]
METAKNFLLLCASFFLALACKNPAAPSARPNNIEKLKNEYTVTYNAKGGKGEMKDSVFTIGVLAKLPPNTFTFEGSVFTGWALAEYGDVEFADKAEIIDLAPAGETITLYASWGINVYTVEYDPNGGEGIMPLSVFTLGKVFALAANAFAKEGYTFAGWALSAGGDAVYADGEEAQDLTPNAGETVVLYAVWKNISYTVAYNANGGSGEMEHSVLSYDEPQDLRPNVFTFEDLVFAGWSTATEGEVVYADEQTVLNLTNIQGEALTLYAIWGSGIYTVSYIANGGSGYMAPGIATLYQEFTLAANSFTREGYFFAGWSLLNNGEVHFEDEASIQNVEDNAGKTIKFYAVWLPEMHITFPHELWALYGQSLSDINIYDNFYCSIPGTCAWEKPDEYFSSAGTYVYKIIFTPEDLVNYTEAAQEAEITVYPRYVDISGRPGRTLIPFDSADELYGKTSMLEITLDGLLDGDIITLGIDEGYGLSLSGNDGIGSKTQRTVVVNYDGSTVDGSGPVSLELHIIGNDNYVLYNAIEFELTVLDGQAENRAIPVTQANAAAFNEYANSPEGLGRHYALAQDITLGQGNNWTPIGASASPFTGGFNGKGFTVSNLAMNSTANYQGMFGYIGTGGLVKNTALINANVKGGSYAGGLAGHSSGTVEGCYVTGSVSGSFYVGGIAGFNSGTVRNCYATSNVNCNSNAGGIVGCNNNGTVLNCFTTGRISGITGIGGIAGLNSMGTIRDCAALNSIITMSSSASTGIGRVTGSAGGGAMTNNYGRSDMMAKHNWNGTNGTNKTITGTGTHSGIDGHGISLEQLDTQSLWVTASNWASAGAWNFTEVWELNANNMPKLRPAGGSQNHALPLGDGTEADPFRVYNEATLRRVGTGTDGWDLDKQYLQIQDVTL